MSRNKNPDKMSEQELRNEVKLLRIQHDNVLTVLTHDRILDKMDGILHEDFDDFDRYQHGVAVIAVRKLVVEALEL